MGIYGIMKQTARLGIDFLNSYSFFKFYGVD